MEPRAAHRYHQEEWEQDLGVRRTAKNVRFELVGESFDTQGRMVDRTTYGPSHGRDCGKDDGDVSHTGKAVLSFPNRTTGIWKGTASTSSSRTQRTSHQGWSRGYFRFAQTLAGNDLSMLDVTSLVVNKPSRSGFVLTQGRIRPWLPPSMPSTSRHRRKGIREGAWRLRRQQVAKRATFL